MTGSAAPVRLLDALRARPRAVLAWTARRVRLLRERCRAVLRLRGRLTDRCADCGRRFGLREVRHGYESSDRVWHAPCQTLRHVRSQLDDLTAYVQFTSDRNARWRAERRLQHLDTAETAKTGGAAWPR